MRKIHMVDLHGQYQHIKGAVDDAIQDVIDSARFIQGPVVQEFEEALAAYLGISAAIGCANGTDALQLALMALGLKPGDEVVVPAFTYVASAEVIALLRLKPVMADVDPDTFNLTSEELARRITPATKAVIPVHLYGQPCHMESIMDVAHNAGIFVIEDNAQALGSDFRGSDFEIRKSGTIGHIGTTSFFPSKNLGCYGDGGAIFTNDESLEARLRMLANHGQSRKYYHDEIGVNSRLDAIQAAILNVKLPLLNDYAAARRKVATYYDAAFEDIDAITTPHRAPFATHVFHQYTIKVPTGSRDDLQLDLAQRGIPSMIYYPLPLYRQKAFHDPAVRPEDFPVTNQLCGQVLSLPIHTEMEEDQLEYISDSVKSFFS